MTRQCIPNYMQAKVICEVYSTIIKVRAWKIKTYMYPPSKKLFLPSKTWLSYDKNVTLHNLVLFH